jgi:uncharacterized protein (DUF1697 family)
MYTYISLLRGINVSGQKRVLMPELKAVYESLGFSLVTTYLQSGNVVFTCDNKDEAATSSKIEATIAWHFGFHVPVILGNRTDF